MGHATPNQTNMESFLSESPRPSPDVTDKDNAIQYGVAGAIWFVKTHTSLDEHTFVICLEGQIFYLGALGSKSLEWNSVAMSPNSGNQTIF